MMKKMKKITFVFLATLVLIGHIVPQVAFANEDSETDIVLDEQNMANEYFEVDEDLDVLEVSSGEYDFELDYIDESSRARKVTKINARIRYAYNSSTKKFDFSFNLDSPTTIINPKLDRATLTIQRSNTKNGTYTNVSSKDFSSPNYTTWYKHSITAKTGHYRIRVSIRPSNGVSASSPTDYAYWLINRTGNIWVWNYTDKVSGKKVTEPNTGWAKGAVHSRPSNLRATYQRDYRANFDSNFTLSTNHEVHHIRPLAQGGSNAFSNLIHLPKNHHQGITAWFRGYH